MFIFIFIYKRFTVKNTVKTLHIGWTTTELFSSALGEVYDILVAIYKSCTISLSVSQTNSVVALEVHDSE